MSSQGKLIVASTRLPVTMAHEAAAHEAMVNDTSAQASGAPSKGGRWQATPSAGGLVTALKSVAERRQFEWIGWPGTTVPDADKAEVSELLSRQGAQAVYLTQQEVSGFYGGFSNSVLWPLFHGFTDRSNFDPGDWETFKRVNSYFADAIAERAQPGDLIWVHDYQLSLVPELLRQKGISCPIGYFLHIPFPSSEIYRTLPVRESVLRGILGADFVGFHAYEYVSHFRKACLRVLGIESQPDLVRNGSRRVHLGVLPIGIDPGEIRDMASTKEAINELTALKNAYKNKKIILGVDRLDYTKGIPDKLVAFGALLEEHPRWRTGCVLIQVAAPSRESVDEYKELKRKVDELVGDINGRYGSPDHTPIVYINQSVNRTRLTGMYQAADIALVTPVRDGMNLVALEYIAARGKQGGSLILSEFAGAAYLLPGARLVSPYNVAEVADTLAEELESEHNESSHMLDFVNDNTSMSWANRFLDRLEETVVENQPAAIRLRVDEAPAVDRLQGAKQPLVFLDYDGTLRSYERKPQDAVPNARIRGVLRELASTATVYVVSGRSGEVLEKWLGDLPIGLVCEHGFAIREAGGTWRPRGAVERATLENVQALLQEFERRTPGSMLETKQSALAWHYRSADPEFGTFQARELLNQLEELQKQDSFAVLRGNKVIEVRPPGSTKGHAVAELLNLHANADAVFCAGDDRTDEEMMEAIRARQGQAAVLCWVGGHNECADFWADSSEALLGELGALAHLWQEARNQSSHSPKVGVEAAPAKAP